MATSAYSVYLLSSLLGALTTIHDFAFFGRGVREERGAR